MADGKDQYVCKSMVIVVFMYAYDIQRFMVYSYVSFGCLIWYVYINDWLLSSECAGQNACSDHRTVDLCWGGLQAASKRWTQGGGRVYRPRPGHS